MKLWPLRKHQVKPVGLTLESGGGVPRKSWRQRRSIKAVTIALLVLAATFAFPRQRIYEFPVAVEDVWRGSDLASPRAFPIFKTTEELQAEYDEIRRSTQPYFRRDDTATAKALADVDSLEARLNRVFGAFADWQTASDRQSPSAAADSARHIAMRRQSGLALTGAQWQILLDSYAATSPELSSTRRASAADRSLDEQLLDHTRQLIRNFSFRLVVDVTTSAITTDEIIVRDEVRRTQEFVDRSQVSDLGDVTREVLGFLRQEYPANAQTIEIGRQLFNGVYRPSLVYLASDTEAQSQTRLGQVSTTRGLVREGEVIVRNGELVTDEIKTKLNSLARTIAERGGRLRGWLILLGQFLISLLICFIFFLFLYILRPHLYRDNRDVVLMSVLLALVIGLFAAAVRLDDVPDLAVPVVIAGILLTVFYDSRVGFIGTLCLAMLGGVYFGNDFKFVVVTVFAGAIAVFSVRDIKRRAPFVTTAGLVFVAYTTLLGSFWLYDVVQIGRPHVEELVLVSINAVLVLLAQPLVLIFERIFGMTTDVSLLELSDTNRDVLRELSIRAPGSFNHSLQVANLSESAADAIGANALLARVGALYHDIGKMQKPEYFVENQQSGFNPHDRLKPRMSALIIASHVRDGLERGRQERLPKIVLDFIPMHHGTARMEYFYNKAVQKTEPDAPPVSDVEFRYPGPRPNTRETGIVMLADSVEAASRSLDEPTPRKLESLVNSIFDARISDGQLDFCPLTFAEITKIRETLLSMLSGIHHLRVKYPGQDDMVDDDEDTAQDAIDSARLGDAS